MMTFAYVSLRDAGSIGYDAYNEIHVRLRGRRASEVRFDAKATNPLTATTITNNQNDSPIVDQLFSTALFLGAVSSIFFAVAFRRIWMRRGRDNNSDKRITKNAVELEDRKPSRSSTLVISHNLSFDQSQSRSTEACFPLTASEQWEETSLSNSVASMKVPTRVHPLLLRSIQSQENWWPLSESPLGLDSDVFRVRADEISRCARNIVDIRATSFKSDPSSWKEECSSSLGFDLDDYDYDYDCDDDDDEFEDDVSEVDDEHWWGDDEYEDDEELLGKPTTTDHESNDGATADPIVSVVAEEDVRGLRLARVGDGRLVVRRAPEGCPLRRGDALSWVGGVDCEDLPVASVLALLSRGASRRRAVRVAATRRAGLDALRAWEARRAAEDAEAIAFKVAQIFRRRPVERGDEACEVAPSNADPNGSLTSPRVTKRHVGKYVAFEKRVVPVHVVKGVGVGVMFSVISHVTGSNKSRERLYGIVENVMDEELRRNLFVGDCITDVDGNTVIGLSAAGIMGRIEECCANKNCSTVLLSVLSSYAHPIAMEQMENGNRHSPPTKGEI